MLIDINLLPRKEAKNIASIVLLASLLIIVIIAASVYVIQQNAVKEDIAQLETTLQDKKLKRVEYEQQLKSFETSESAVKLNSAIDWMEASSIDSVPILEHLTSLLPERGFILMYQYNEDGSLQVSVQFDTSRESAYYLKELRDSTYFQDAKIVSLLTNQIEEENEVISTEEKVGNDKYIPRYVAIYDLTLNTTTLLANQKGEN
ncbi:hypothetical protein FZW96_04825 [Bacillus sp. BGMRC 2118]|nr:hypothetical protein FZW96_04825 [Bacillus sp. BGMRC 2118]